MKNLLFATILAAAATGCRLCDCGCCDDRPNVSVFGSSVEAVAKQRGVSLAEAADLLVEAGVTGFDYDYKGERLAELAATSLKPINLYGFMDFYAPDNGRAECDKYVATAVKYGVPRIMCVPTKFTNGVANEAELQKNLSGLKYLAKVATAAGVTVMIEDVGWPASPCSYSKNLKLFLTEIPELRFALDSGNLYYANRGESILDMMKYAGDRIEHVHLKDQPPSNHRTYATLGLGGVENAEVVRAMHARGYDGWYTLENMVGDDELEDVIRQIAVLRYWRRTACLAGK